MSPNYSLIRNRSELGQERVPHLAQLARGHLMTPLEVIPAGFTIPTYGQKGLCGKKYTKQVQKTQNTIKIKSEVVKVQFTIINK